MDGKNNITNKCGRRAGVIVPAILLISFALGLVIPYAHYVAYGGDPSLGYRAVKGLTVAILCAATFWFAGKYGYSLIKKYREPVLYFGTALILAFTVFEYSLKSIEIPVLSRVIAYSYAALPFLKILTLCAMALSLNDILSGSPGFRNAARLFVSVLLTMLLENSLKTAVLVLLVYLLIGRFKAKSGGGKTALIIISVITAGLFIYLACEWKMALRFLISVWHNPAYMRAVCGKVWSNAKLFGTMNGLKSVGGGISDFALLWLVGFFGIIPAILIAAALILLFILLLKNTGGCEGLNPLAAFAVIYPLLRGLLAVLTNCGIIFKGFMTPMPLIMDTVAGMLCVFWLLGMKSGCSRNEKTKLKDKNI